MKKTILLVDDEIDILDIQHRYLIQAGYDVLVAHGWQGGIRAFQKKSTRPHYHRYHDAQLWTVMILSVKFSYIAPDQPFLFTTAKTSEQDKIYG